MVKDIFAFAMKNAGIEVSTDVCEHFKYTRQELYDIVRVRQTNGARVLFTICCVGETEIAEIARRCNAFGGF